MRFSFRVPCTIEATVDVDPAEFVDCDNIGEVREIIAHMLDDVIIGAADADVDDELDEAAEAVWNALHAEN